MLLQSQTWQISATFWLISSSLSILTWKWSCCYLYFWFSYLTSTWVFLEYVCIEVRELRSIWNISKCMSFLSSSFLVNSLPFCMFSYINCNVCLNSLTRLFWENLSLMLDMWIIRAFSVSMRPDCVAWIIRPLEHVHKRLRSFRLS